ncbi:hypothetical protein CLV98_1238 [Dyadobacter jejuensis]|uniref:Uncharacterized protein n=2 Tax=Dyadobacter jejuensis TaxID=1082580 RepID=A0A316A6Q9_9BACT|nr:hypothetical protein CLV98_1238 [Dyadobacter jejuensis]
MTDIIKQKGILLKALRLERSLQGYSDPATAKMLDAKLVQIFGPQLANHFLSKYSDAESLIWSLDEENLKLFIERF